MIAGLLILKKKITYGKYVFIYNIYFSGLGSRASAAYTPQRNCHIIILKFSWMFKPVPKQTINLFRFYLHTSGFNFEAIRLVAET